MTRDGNGKGDAANRVPITIAVMLATIMASLDSTIANVALPHIQGSVQASADQITWVLTSYIIAAAIMTPMTGYLAGRFGRKLVFLVCIIGFTAVSMLCGIGDSLVEMVVFRLLQGMFGAALIPLSQAVLLDINPPERHGQAMAVWGAGAVIGPILGPALGGWLTEHLSWRWVFFINLPIGIMALLGFVIFMAEKRASERTRFDFLGFASLSIAMASFQLLLDRGPGQDWFDSTEIWTYLVVGAISLWVFCVQVATAEKPFVSKALLTNWNFVAATAFNSVLGLLLFSTMALMPTLAQNVLGYSASYTGLLTMPRGVGSFIAMFAGGFMLGRVHPKIIMGIGVAVSIFSLWLTTLFNLEMDAQLILWWGLLQGIGVGLVFVVLSTIAFATVRPEHRTEGAGLFTLIRSLGASVGISIMQARLVAGVEVHHARLVEHARPDNPLYQAYLHAPYGFDSPAGLASLNNMITAHASMLSYLDDFQLMFGITLLCAPLVLFMRTPESDPKETVHVVGE